MARSLLYLLLIIPLTFSYFAQTSDYSGPNILFILTDDQRWDSLGCYGNPVIQTPNLDKLASQGARLDAFYVASPLCCPSRATFLSGFYPHQTGIESNAGLDLADGTKTVATLLNRAGYVTGFIGKAHLGGDPNAWGFKECPLYLPNGSSTYKNPRLVLNGKEQVVPGNITALFADSAIRFLVTHQKERWFLWLAITAPHSPLIKDKEFVYKARNIKPPPGWPKDQPFKGETWDKYYSTVSQADREIGRVLKTLDELGLRKNTFIFMTSDNGYMWGSHGYEGKRVWFDESARVPALVCWPGRIKPGTKVASLVSSVDFLPTMLDVAGQAAEKGLDGVSMLPLLLNGSVVRTAIYSEVKAEPSWQMVRTDRWKYVYLYPARMKGAQIPERHLLYDMKTDPWEQKDLSSSNEHSETLLQMKNLLSQWLRNTENGPKQPRKAKLKPNKSSDE